LKPFTVQISFVNNSAGTLTKINGSMIQGSNIYTYTPCSQNASYLSTFGSQLKGGMVFIASLWGGSSSSLSWLNGNRCSGDCVATNTTRYTVSNISLAKL
jgi:hypothetical protein